jgi:hypothetical protein
MTNLVVFLVFLFTIAPVSCSENKNNDVTNIEVQTTQNNIPRTNSSGFISNFFGRSNGSIPEEVKNGSEQDKINYLLNQQETVRKLNQQIETLNGRVNELKNQSNSVPGFTDMLRIAALIKEIPGIVDAILKTTGNNSDVALKWAKHLQEGLLKDTDLYLDAILKTTGNNSDVALKWTRDFMEGLFLESGKHSDEMKAVMYKLSTEFTKEFEEFSKTFMNEKREFFTTSTEEVNEFMTMITTKMTENLTRVVEDNKRDVDGNIVLDAQGNPIRITPLATLQATFAKGVGKNMLFFSVGAFFPYFFFKFFFGYLPEYLKKPQIILESTARFGIMRFFKMILPLRLPIEKLSNLVLPQKTLDMITHIINFEKSALQRNGALKNILFVGPPGVGKTFIAKAIARELKLPYVMITGSSLFQDGAGVRALDQFFMQAKNQKMVLFIDELDSLFASRDLLKPDSEGYRLLNHILNYTGTENNQLILIGSTNRPHIFDPAARRRFHFVVPMETPQLHERLTFLDKVGTPLKESSAPVATHWQLLAEKTEGLSYPEIKDVIDFITFQLKTTSVQNDKDAKSLIALALAYIQNRKDAFAAKQ